MGWVRWSWGGTFPTQEVQGAHKGLVGDHEAIVRGTGQDADVVIEVAEPNQHARRDTLAAKSALAIPSWPPWFAEGTRRGVREEVGEGGAMWELDTSHGIGDCTNVAAAAAADAPAAASDAPDVYAASYMAEMVSQLAAAPVENSRGPPQQGRYR